MEFLGESIQYWMELKDRMKEMTGADYLTVKRLLNENVKLQGKVSFYESRIEEMNQIRKQDE